MPVRLPIVEEPPRDFTESDGSVWTRSGGCNRCGQCCGSGDPFNGEAGEATVAGACPAFRWDQEPTETELGWGRCLARDPETATPAWADYYANGCAHWPPRDVTGDFPACSYTFTRNG